MRPCKTIRPLARIQHSFQTEVRHLARMHHPFQTGIRPPARMNSRHSQDQRMMPRPVGRSALTRVWRCTPKKHHRKRAHIHKIDMVDKKGYTWRHDNAWQIWMWWDSGERNWMWLDDDGWWYPNWQPRWRGWNDSERNWSARETWMNAESSWGSMEE